MNKFIRWRGGLRWHRVTGQSESKVTGKPLLLTTCGLRLPEDMAIATEKQPTRLCSRCKGGKL